MSQDGRQQAYEDVDRPELNAMIQQAFDDQMIIIYEGETVVSNGQNIVSDRFVNLGEMR